MCETGVECTNEATSGMDLWGKTHTVHASNRVTVWPVASHTNWQKRKVFIKCGEMVCEWMCIGGSATHTFVGVELWKW